MSPVEPKKTANTVRTACLAALGWLALAPLAAMAYNEPPPPAIGTNTVATADLLVTRPATKPCAVTLFSRQEFVGFDPMPLAYAPPPGCSGPWAKVVLEADYAVTAGVQFDRTAIIQIGGVNLYFGTTMEPGAKIARSWHVERDVTDYAALLRSTQAGEAILFNVVDDTYTGRLFGSARLLFYPADAANPAAKVPSIVQPLAPSLTYLSPTNPTLSTTLALPTNVERLYVDVIAQSQSGDEFWYTCVPDDYAAVLQSCAGGAFREVELTIDGTPAGVAPVFPWIYTGGIDPAMWAPVPGVQTLSFEPQRVDLTPFAGLLNDGHPHQLGLRVYGAQSYFTVVGTLTVWQDEAAQVVPGALTANTLASPVVNVDTSGLVVDGANAHGPVNTTSTRRFEVAGYVDTSHGRVETTVRQQMSFANLQKFSVSGSRYLQAITQNTDVAAITTVKDAAGTATRSVVSHYPLTMDIRQTIAHRTATLDTVVTQSLQRSERRVAADGSVWQSKLQNTVMPKASASVNVATGRTHLNGMSSLQHFVRRETGAGCYDRTISVEAGAVSAVADRCGR